MYFDFFIILVISPFGFEDFSCVLIASVPDCILLTFNIFVFLVLYIKQFVTSLDIHEIL